MPHSHRCSDLSLTLDSTACGISLLYHNNNMFRGLEAAAALLVLGLLFLALSLYAPDKLRSTWLLTTVAFVQAWVRLEFAAISLTAGVVPYFAYNRLIFGGF